MDRGYNNRYLHEQRVEEWREKRAQKMANRLQRNSDRPRTVSSSILGYGNYRQPSNLQPGQRHPEDPRYNNHGGDPRWNPNYNYSGYREHNVPHNQYQHQHDYRVDHRSHGSYHQGQGQKRGHYSSQKSLYNNRKSVNNPSRQYSSSSNINSTNEVENPNVSHPEKNNEIKSENLVSEPNSSKSTLEDNTGTCVTFEPESQLDNASSIISPDVGIDVGNICESFIPDPLSVVDDYDAAGEDHAAVELLDYEPSAELCDDNLPGKLPVDCGSALVMVEKEIIDVGLTIDPRSVEHINNKPSESTVVTNEEETVTINSSVDSIQEQQAENNDYLCSEEEKMAIVEKSVVSESENVAVLEQTEKVSLIAESVVAPVIENVAFVEESVVAPEAENVIVKEQTYLVPETNNVEMLASEAVTSTNDISPISLETTYENTVEISTMVPSADEMMVVPDISSLAPCETSNESLGLELSLSYENNTEVDDLSDLHIVKATKHSEPNLQSDEAIEEKSIAGTSNNGVENSDVPAVLTVAGNSETEASMLVPEEHDDIAKEIVNVGNKLAKVSIANNKDDECRDNGFMTPVKKERNKVLLDATNILPSSMIQYAVREVRKKDATEVIVTPVRRSLRISSVRTPVSKQNLCVQKLEELSPEVKQKMKFVPNPSINTPSDS